MKIKVDKIVNAIVTVGVPLTVYGVLLFATGGKGAAHISPVLKSIGLGSMKNAIPVSVCGGFVLGQTSELVVDTAIKLAVISEYKSGMSKKDLKELIDTYNVSEDLKVALKDSVDNFADNDYVSPVEV